MLVLCFVVNATDYAEVMKFDGGSTDSGDFRLYFSSSMSASGATPSLIRCSSSPSSSFS